MAELTAFDQANISHATDQSLCSFVGLALQELAEVKRSVGNRAQANLYFEKAWPLYQELRAKSSVAGVLQALGNLALVGGDYDSGNKVFHAILKNIVLGCLSFKCQSMFGAHRRA